MKIGVPSTVTMISSFLIQSINVSFAGHLGEESIMAGVGMANMYVNIFCMSLMMGLNGTLNTFVSQAYGFGDYWMCGVYLNRGRIVMTLLYIPLFVLFLFTEKTFNLLGFDPQASYYS